MSLSYHKSIDEFLGERDSRYFGDGYLNTVQTVSGFVLSDTGHGLKFQCVGTLILPRTWSIKASGNQKPHLSTIDVIEFALECVRLLLQKTLRTLELPAGIISRIEIVSGKNPVEENLDAINISGHVKDIGTGLNLLEITIANMAVSVYLDTDISSSKLVFGQKKRAVSIGDVLVNKDDMTAVAAVKPSDHSLTDAWSLSSCFASTLQIGQALLYKLDGIDRASSNTLWMKRTSITIFAGVPPLQFEQPIHVKLVNARRYRKGDADWRSAEISAIICNTKIVCAVTHQLPAEKGRKEAKHSFAAAS